MSEWTLKGIRFLRMNLSTSKRNSVRCLAQFPSSSLSSSDPFAAIIKKKWRSRLCVVLLRTDICPYCVSIVFFVSFARMDVVASK